MQPGRRRASLFLALLGLSLVPLIVAPPEKGTEASSDEIVDETINTTADPEDDYTPGYWMKRSFERGQKELQKAIDNMSIEQQFPVNYDSVSGRTERNLKEAQQMLKEIKSYKKRFWLESFAYFLENMLNKVKPDRKYKKSNTSIENVRESFVTEENSLSFNRSPMPLVTSNFEQRESNNQAFASIPPLMEEDSVATLPDKSKSTQSDKVTITALSEFVDHSLHSPTIISLETSNLQESQAIPESPKPDNAQESQAIRISTETYSPRKYHDTIVSSGVNSPQKSHAISLSTETYIPQEPQDMIASSKVSVPQESRYTSVSSEARVPQESQAVHVSSETKIPQETHETSETNTAQKPRNMPESPESSSNLNQKSASKFQSSEQEHSSSYLPTAQGTVPETNQLHVDDNLTYNDQANFPAVARVFPVLDNLGKLQIDTKTINNRIEEIEYIDELEKELLEIARLQALERSKNTSTSINSTDMSPPITTIKRNSFDSIDEKSESTIDGRIQKSPTLPQSLSASPLMTDETTSDHAVPETGHQQTVQLTPDAQSALPKAEQAIPMHGDQEITTTAVLQDNNAKPDEETMKDLEIEKIKEVEEEDELVRELEELPRLAALERARSSPIPSVNPFDASTPATVKRSSFVTDYQTTNEEEKRRIEINMAKEIRELHRLGAKQEEIIEALGVNSLHSLDGQESVKIGPDAEIHKVQDSNTDEMIHKNNPNTWKPFGSPFPPKPYTNDSYEGMHLSMPPMKERIVTNQMQGGYRWAPYNVRLRTDSRNIQNTLRKLQRENYLLKTRLMSYTQTNPNIHKIRGVTYSGPSRLNQFLPHETRYPAELSLGQNVPNPGGPPIYTPYPYITNSDPKNFTLQDDMGKTSPLVSKPLPQNTNSEFSDEMKRELRDGKVILLSDSVVRSNFEPEKDRDEGGKETKGIPEEGDTGIQAQT